MKSKTLLKNPTKRKLFLECAKLIKESVLPSQNIPITYVGLEHIEQDTLRFSSIGKSSDVVSQKFKFKKNDILFGKLRPYFRKVIKPSFDGICSTDIFVVRAKEGISQSFLYYLMTSQKFVDYASKGSEGTRMPRAKWEFLEKYQQDIPDIDKQEKIGKILSDLDTEIENLQNQNKILEQIAQAIFKSWFVDFDGVIEFEDSELGLIPKEWKVGNLEDICEITMGQSPPSTSYNEEEDGIIFFQGKTDFGDFFPIPRMYCTMPKRFAEKNDVLFTVRAPVGSINIANEKYCIGRGLASLRLKENHGCFLYFFLKYSNLEWSKFEAGGTVFGSVNKDDLKKYRIIISLIEIRIKFNAMVNPIYNLIWKNNVNVQLLTKTRDVLLPKLMSGEIRV